MNISHTEQKNEASQIISSMVQSLESFTTIYILSEGGGTFGLCVITVDRCGNLLDSIFIDELCHSIGEARSIFHAVADGAVTPCTLTDVISDLICI